jgi:hypothetical protein
MADQKEKPTWEDVLAQRKSEINDIWFMRPEYDWFPDVEKLRAEELARRARKMAALENESSPRSKGRRGIRRNYFEEKSLMNNSLGKKEGKDYPPTPKRNGVR